MPTLSIDIASVPQASRGHLLYALNFCDPCLNAASVDGDTLKLDHAGDAEAIQRKAGKLIARYSQAELALHDDVLADLGTQRSIRHDCFDELVAMGVVVPQSPGRLILRGWFAQLVEAIDRESLRRVAAPLGATDEHYPNAIESSKLARTHHIGSFPEHLHFLVHLREDLDVIDRVADRVRQDGSDWTAPLADTITEGAGEPYLVMNPSVCYHCYASREGLDVGDQNQTISARSHCHRYESKALSGLRRLSDFDMREVIFLGHPDWVKTQRAKSEDLIAQWFSDWDLSGQIVNANDPFFTDDFETKAAFQRRQDLKHEFAVPMPTGSPMAISSSNFHSTTFGKAFNVTRKGRPICTACIGFGLERWAYAVCLQHGTEPTGWPDAIRKAMGEQG